MSNEVKRIERNWVGHYIYGSREQFHKNTLIKLGRKEIVISTLGVVQVVPNYPKMDNIEKEIYFETIAFYPNIPPNSYTQALKHVARRIDADKKQSIIESKASEMHEAVVNEFTVHLLKEIV